MTHWHHAPSRQYKARFRNCNIIVLVLYTNTIYTWNKIDKWRECCLTTAFWMTWNHISMTSHHFSVTYHYYICCRIWHGHWNRPVVIAQRHSKEGLPQIDNIWIVMKATISIYWTMQPFSNSFWRVCRNPAEMTQYRTHQYTGISNLWSIEF